MAQFGDDFSVYFYHSRLDELVCFTAAAQPSIGQVFI
jgi:hypothetical protein